MSASDASPSGREFQRIYARKTMLGPLEIRRALPLRERRMVGPWCFLDRYGPLSFSEGRPMDVLEHPHIGLQTVSYLVEGEVLHLDSLGCQAIVRPGGVNVMTSGRGIAHVELTPAQNSGRLNGVQLWVALPDAARHTTPSFDPVASVPQIALPSAEARVFTGTFVGTASPAQSFSDQVGADIECRGGDAQMPLESSWEHAVFFLAGDATLDDQVLEPDTLYYLGTGRSDLTIRSKRGARLLLLGGPPFGESVVMWWNFVARTHDEIRAARERWESRAFEPVRGYDGPRIDAPGLGARARPNPAS